MSYFHVLLQFIFCVCISKLMILSAAFAVHYYSVLSRNARVNMVRIDEACSQRVGVTKSAAMPASSPWRWRLHPLGDLSKFSGFYCFPRCSVICSCPEASLSAWYILLGRPQLWVFMLLHCWLFRVETRTALTGGLLDFYVQHGS